MKLIKSLCEKFGYRLVKISDELPKVVQAFAHEIDRERTLPPFGSSTRSTADLLNSVCSWSQSLALELAHNPRPEIVREKAATAASYLMFIALRHGELFPGEMN